MAEIDLAARRYKEYEQFLANKIKAAKPG